MSSSTDEDGTAILPIPPPLEFPYPEHVVNSSKSSLMPDASAARSATNLPPNNHAFITGGPTTPGLLASTSTPQPRPRISKKKFMTERPLPAQRASLLGMKRRQTGAVSNTGDGGTWSSDSDSMDTSSSEDENELTSRSKMTSHNTSHSVGEEKSKSKKGSDRRRSSLSRFSRFSVGNDNFKTKGKVSKRDGRLNISVNETANAGYLAKALGATLQHHLPGRKDSDGNEQMDEPLSPLREEDAVRPGMSRGTTASTLSTAPSVYDTLPVPKLNIVVMVIGSRGDIQPFLKIGKELKEKHGHRVRIATHPAFKTFVEEDSGLEFFSVGGDPAELMAFMVKNPGLVPSVSTVRAGDIGRKRDSMFEMFQGFWRACINATDDEKDVANVKMMGDKHPFVADAIIANPPSFAHIHCSERLGIPLHLMFTFPYSPTQQFPHPLANIRNSNVDANYTNFMSYPLVEMMTWQGLGDLVNRFRVKTLGLEPVSTLWAPGQLFRMKVPYTYLWSPGLIPKPADWGPEIDLAGFVFLDLASSFKPPEELTKFLDAGPPPVYIGFGSIVVDDPDKFTSLIFEAVKKAGVRALVSKGWGGLGDEGNTPENIFMLENTPHDWLFPRVSAVVHHGGAGTTAIGLKCGKPTMIVPFFGDQPFWGNMVSRAGAGAQEPVPYKHLTADRLAEGIQQCLSPEAKARAEGLAQDIDAEGDGAANAVKSFHRSLPMRGEHSMRCSILQERVAVWQLKRTNVRFSALAADILIEKRKLKWHDLRLLRFYEWNDFEGPGEPFTGAGAAFVNAASGVVKGVGGTPVRWAKSVKKMEKRQQRKSTDSARKSREMSRGRKNSSRFWSNPGTENHFEQNGENEVGLVPQVDELDANAVLSDRQVQLGTINLGDTKLTNQSSISPDGSSPTCVNDDSSMYDAGEESDENIAQDIAHDTGAGLAQAGGALAKAPMDLSIAISQGFHNAPRLYGDSTVRRPTRISGIQSGLKAAGEEFAFGIYDGWTGLATQPYQGAKKEGAIGFAKGVGKGFGGFVLKDLAALTAPFGYTLKGIHKELVKGQQPTGFIRKARIIQGQKDLRHLQGKEREGAVEATSKGWHIITGIRDEVFTTDKKNLKQRWMMHKEKKKWSKHGAFENVEQASKALDAKKKGKSFDEVFESQRRQLKKAQGPRKSTMTKAQRQGKAGQEKWRRQEKEKKEKAETTIAGGEEGTAVGDKAALENAVREEKRENNELQFQDEKRADGEVNGSTYMGQQTGIDDAGSRQRLMTVPAPA